MGDLVVREAVEADRPGIEEVAAAALVSLDHSPSVRMWGSEMRRRYVAERLPRDPPAGPDRHVVVALTGGRLAGVGTVHPMGRHRGHAFLGLDVAPAFRRRGVGSALLAAMASRVDRPLAVHAFLSDPGTVAFYRRHGFRTGEVALEGRIDPADPRTAAWIDAAGAAAPPVVPLDASTASRLEVARLLDAVYVHSHPWSPPDPLPDERAIAVYLGRAIDGTTFCAHAGGELIGAGTLVASPFGDDPGVGHLVWVGVGDPARPDGRSTTRALLARCLSAAGAVGRRIQVEVNDNHAHLHGAVLDVPGTALYEDLTTLVSA